MRIILIHAEPDLDQSICEDQIEARSKNIPRAVYKSRDGVDLPEASTFMLHATPAPILYERPISSWVEVAWLFPV